MATKIKDILISIFVYGIGMELMEELLEEAFAWGFTELFAWVVTRAFSAVVVFTFTQTTKYAIKKIMKCLIYKEGYDKMAILKKYWKLAWGNKVTGFLTGLGFAASTFCQDYVAYATGCWWIALIVFIVGYNIGIFFGGETLEQIIARCEAVALNKAEKKRLKNIKNKVKELANKQQEALYAQASEIVKAEEAKAEVEVKKTN